MSKSPNNIRSNRISELIERHRLEIEEAISEPISPTAQSTLKKFDFPTGNFEVIKKLIFKNIFSVLTKIRKRILKKLLAVLTVISQNEFKYYFIIVYL